MISKLQLESIRTVDINLLANLVEEGEFRSYFLEEPGKEHYRLLSYISTLYTDSTILDIGTYKGCSALALSFNPTNKVISFDIQEGTTRLLKIPGNIEFRVGSILDSKYKDLILNSPLIMLDTAHEGPFEHEFYEYLTTVGYRGILLLDDIHLNEPMKIFWNNIGEEKYDISRIGHHSGTGLVVF